MALIDERETLIRIDYAERRVYVESTERGWWNHCETIGMVCDMTHPQARRYVGGLATNRAGPGLRSLVGGKLPRPRHGDVSGAQNGNEGMTRADP